MHSIGKSIKLLIVFLSVQLYQWREETRIRRRYYSNKIFKKIDLSLARAYRHLNPYHVCKMFLLQKGVKDPYQYGETPLTSMEQIVKECGIRKEDRFLDLGCGSGRALFFLSEWIGCRVLGIDWVPTFISIAKWLVEKHEMKQIDFRCQNFYECDLNEATIIYLYGTCLEEVEIRQLVLKFQNLASGTKIITVSYPLSRYSESSAFTLCKRFYGSYPWGRAEIFLQQKD